MTYRLFAAASAAVLLAACGAAEDEAETGGSEAVEQAAEAEAGGSEAVEAPAEAEAEDAAAPAEAASLETILADARRDEDRARDAFRNPAETLALFEIAPEQSVVEALPGGGWYSRILAPYLNPQGRYMAINYSVALFEELFGADMPAERRASVEQWEARFAEQAVEWGGEADGAFRFGAVPADAAGSADRVLYVRALHNMARTGRLEVAVSDAFTLLRPGGLVGVVQHRAPEEAEGELADGSRGYLRQSDVVAAFEAGGFELVEASEINANPADDGDHPNGVWTLPPRLAVETEEDRAAYQAIGESDRMTLKFRKPAQ